MVFERFLNGFLPTYKRILIISVRRRSIIISMIVQPILWMVVLGKTFDNILGGSPFGAEYDYLTYLACGVITMTVLFSSLFGGMTLLFDKEFGMMKEFLVAPIPRSTIPLGNGAGIATRSLFQAILVLLLGVAVGAKFNLNLYEILPMFFAIILVSLGFFSLTAALVTKIESIEGFQGVMQLTAMPLFFVSGAIYPIVFLPQGLQEFAKYSPITHVVSIIRYYLIGEKAANFDVLWGSSHANIGLFLSFVYLFFFAIALLFLACWAFKKQTI
jgi:ABC-2 type transport system permease protein